MDGHITGGLLNSTRHSCFFLQPNQFIQFNPILIIVSKEVSTDQTWAVSLQLQHKEEEALPILFLHLSTLLCTLSWACLRCQLEQFSHFLQELTQDY
mmetsp:Transcript_592/g.1170  ORF Transcript_592/g.1170 Transcript_592/m.1170 type:complete len:97 (+) Transcript_592:438-728(+)